jgi:hypothetical protein
MWKYSVQPKPPVKGFIIQRVFIECDIKKCGGKPNVNACKFYEVISRQLNPKDPRPTYDYLTWPFSGDNNTTGSYNQTAQAKFFGRDERVESEDGRVTTVAHTIARWAQDGEACPDCKTSSVGYRWTLNADWWGIEEGRARPGWRYGEVAWTCCPDCAPAENTDWSWTQGVDG